MLKTTILSYILQGTQYSPPSGGGVGEWGGRAVKIFLQYRFIFGEM